MSDRISWMDRKEIWHEALKIDEYLKLLPGTAENAIFHFKPDSIALLAESVKIHGIRIEPNGAIPKEENNRTKWKVLLKQIGMSRTFWMDGTGFFDGAEEQADIPVIGEDNVQTQNA